MFDKMFESAARKLVTENAFDRWCMKRQYQKAERLGAITRYPNGTQGVDIVKIRAHNLKWSVLRLLVIYPAAAIIGHILGSIKSKN